MMNNVIFFVMMFCIIASGIFIIVKFFKIKKSKTEQPTVSKKIEISTPTFELKSNEEKKVENVTIVADVLKAKELSEAKKLFEDAVDNFVKDTDVKTDEITTKKIRKPRKNTKKKI
jgi:tellurite resistance protein